MPSRIAFCVSLSKRYFFPLLTSWSFHLSSSLLGFITPGLGGDDPWISTSLLGLLFPPGLYSMLFYLLEMPNFALLKSRVYRFWCVASSQPSISWTPQCDGYSSCNRMHIPHRSSWWEQGPAKHPLTISSSITWRRKLFLMHFRNFQQILGQVSPLGQWNASALHILLWKQPQHAPAGVPGSVCPLCSWSIVLPRAALCGHGEWHHSSWPHAHLISHMRDDTSLQVSALPGVSQGQDRSLPPYAKIVCSAAECACCSTLQLMFY